MYGIVIKIYLIFVVAILIQKKCYPYVNPEEGNNRSTVPSDPIEGYCGTLCINRKPMSIIMIIIGKIYIIKIRYVPALLSQPITPFA